MREMKESGISSFAKIPSDWEIKKFKNVFSLQSVKSGGKGQLLSVYLDKGVISYEDSDGQQVHKPSLDMSNYQIVNKGDFVLNNQQAWRGSVGISKYEGIISPAYFVYRIDVPSDMDYMNYLLRDNSMVQQYETASRGVGTIQRNLFAPWLLNSWVILPPVKTQAKIAAYLNSKCTEIDALSADIQSEIDTLHAYKRSVITEAVTKGLDKNAPMKDSGTEWLGNIPKHWNMSRIGSIYRLRNTKVSDRDFEPLSVTMKGVVPQLDTAAKTNAHDDRKLVRKGDFVINSRSDRRGSCGISPLDGSVSLINTVLSPLDEMNAEYYGWLFHTAQFADEFYKWGHGIVDDLWTTGWQDMKRIIIPYPPLAEQECIAKYLNNKCSEIDNVMSSKQEQLEVLADYKKSIIYEYVTGKKEVPANEDIH